MQKIFFTPFRCGLRGKYTSKLPALTIVRRNKVENKSSHRQLHFFDGWQLHTAHEQGVFYDQILAHAAENLIKPKLERSSKPGRSI